MLGMYKMGIYLDGKIIDGYKDSMIKNANTSLNNKFRFKYLNYFSDFFKCSVKYIDINENIVLRLDKDVNEINDNILSQAVDETYDILGKILDFEEYDKIMKVTVCIKSEIETYVADIYKEDFNNKEKYREKFLVEVFDI